MSSTFGLSDDELDHVISLASAVPIDARSAFLEAVAWALSAYYREAARQSRRRRGTSRAFANTADGDLFDAGTVQTRRQPSRLVDVLATIA